MRIPLGSAEGYLFETLRQFLDYNYAFDATKPSRFRRRVMDTSLARKLSGYDFVARWPQGDLVLVCQLPGRVFEEEQFQGLRMMPRAIPCI